MQNTYEATIKLGHARETVTVQARDLYHARLMLEAQYGRGNVMNLHQRS
jgi:hypothetical protein